VQSFPRQIKNLCFEVQLSAEELVFDYKLANGVTQTMNATFLMKKMGIISNS
jgi:DNA mismatch repair ATPase MutS